jgi:phosphonate transport system ATP-binding protein
VLADEPVSALDVRLGRAVVQQLFQLVAQEHTLVVSLHSLSLLDEGFDRILAMRDGRIVHDGPPSSLSKKLLQEVYGAELAQIDVSPFHLADDEG